MRYGNHQLTLNFRFPAFQSRKFHILNGFLSNFAMGTASGHHRVCRYGWSVLGIGRRSNSHRYRSNGRYELSLHRSGAELRRQWPLCARHFPSKLRGSVNDTYCPNASQYASSINTERMFAGCLPFPEH